MACARRLGGQDAKPAVHERGETYTLGLCCAVGRSIHVGPDRARPGSFERHRGFMLIKTLNSIAPLLLVPRREPALTAVAPVAFV